MVGASLQLDNHTAEYWMPMTIDTVADEPLDTYLLNLQDQWQARIRELSPYIARCVYNAPMRFTFRMRYQGNVLRVSFTPEEIAGVGIDKPLAEAPVPRDRWVSNEAEVLTYPPTPDEHAAGSAQLLSEV
jgi:hypothetical protein